MLFHVTMTHSPDNCPGHKKDLMPAALASLDKLKGLETELAIKVHYFLWGAPEHVAFALIEAESPDKLARYVMSVDIPQDYKVVPVQHMDEVITMAKAMIGQGQGGPPPGQSSPPSAGTPVA
ncbi:MAG: DUF3303 domain-containing protein [Nitrososphaerales archaeon]